MMRMIRPTTAANAYAAVAPTAVVELAFAITPKHPPKSKHKPMSMPSFSFLAVCSTVCTRPGFDNDVGPDAIGWPQCGHDVAIDEIECRHSGQRMSGMPAPSVKCPYTCHDFGRLMPGPHR